MADEGTAGTQWNRSYGDGIDATGLQLIQHYSARVDEIEAKQNGAYVAVIEPRSSLQLDDRYLGTWRGASLPVGAQAASMDSLLTVRTLVLETGVIPMTALYPLLRAVIENAALAIYLLAPSDRVERLRRSYLVADDDARLRCSHELERAMAMPSPVEQEKAAKSATDKREKVRGELVRLIGMHPELGSPSAFVFSRIEYSNLVQIAADVLLKDPAVKIESDMSLLAMWQVLSGLSHGKQWAMVEVLERSQAIVNTADGTAHVKMTTSPAVIAWFMERGIQTLECALRLYAQRSLTHLAQPEDAEEPRE